MAQTSVKKAAEKLQPVKAYIERCWHSPKRNHIFCLVEGSFDKHIYENRVNTFRFEVKIATDDALHHNRNSVHYLVKELYELHPNGRFIGIRDKDYMAIVGQQCSPHIFTTDYRDIEMMILASPSFQDSDSNISTYLEEILPHCLHLSHIRIYAEKRNLHHKLNDKVKITCIYNQNYHVFVNDTKSVIRQRYFKAVDSQSNNECIDNFISEENLLSYSPYDICRGHDVVSLMGYIHGLAYTRAFMEEKMNLHYSISDFHATKLFKELQAYCRSYSIEI